MNPHRLMLRRRLLELMYSLAVLELELEAAKDDFRESACLHNEVLMSFVMEQKLLDIKKTKYDIKHMET